MNGKPATHNKINTAARLEQADAAAILDAENGLIRLADVLEELPEGHLSEEAARYILSVVRQNCEKIRYTEVTDQVVANYNILDILDGLPTIEDEVKMLMSDLLAMFNQVEAAQEMLDEAKACRADHPSDTDLDLDEMIRRRRLRLAVRTEIGSRRPDEGPAPLQGAPAGCQIGGAVANPLPRRRIRREGLFA